MKKKLFNYFLIIIFLFGCKENEPNEKKILDQNIQYSQSIKNKLSIDNLKGDFGDILISQKSKRVFHLTNFHTEPVKIISVKLSNTFFTIPGGYPGVSSLNSNDSSIPPCSSRLDSGKSCKIGVIFEPKSTNKESDFLTINYAIKSGSQQFKYKLTGNGRNLTQAQKLLAMLKNNMIETPVSQAYKGKKINSVNLINSVLEKGHSRVFSYSDFFNDPTKKGYEVWEKQLKVKRVIGYTFRSDTRGPDVHFSKCGEEWNNGYELTDPITGNTIKYPPQRDEKNNPLNCGIKNVGGFWPTATRPSDLKFINSLLIDYKKRTGKDFNLAEHPINDLPNSPGYGKVVIPEIPGQGKNIIPENPGIRTAHLNWYLQNILNVSAHVHASYDFKGFLSTTMSPGYAFAWPGEWVYVSYVEGGFKLPDSSDSSFKISDGSSFTMREEYEVAVPGGILWEDIVAYTEKGSNKIYFREGFQNMDPVAYHTLHKLLSSYL